MIVKWKQASEPRAEDRHTTNERSSARTAFGKPGSEKSPARTQNEDPSWHKSHEYVDRTLVM